MKSVTERTWWQPAIQFSVPTPKLQESTHETEKKVGLFYDVLWCSGWVCSCSLFRVPRSILRTSGLASSGSEGWPQTFTECTAPRCTEALVLSTVLWVSMDHMKLELELHGIPWKAVGMPELKQNKHFTSYLTSHHQRKATKVAAYQILSDLIRSYQDTVYPVYTCFEATHCVACGRGRYPPRWTWRPAQLCWCWASGWEIFQERPRRSKMFMKSGQVHALSGPFILCHFILFETFDILIFVDSFPIWKAFGLTEFAACGRNRLSSARHQTQLTLRPRRTGRGVRSWITLASGD